MQQPAGGDGGQSSHDTWDTAKPKGKWRENSAEIDAVGIGVKEKKNTLHTSGKESRMRETELFTMVDVAATDEKQEERERCMIRDQLVEVRKKRKKRTKQGTSSKRCNATLTMPRIKVMRRGTKAEPYSLRIHRSF